MNYFIIKFYLLIIFVYSSPVAAYLFKKSARKSYGWSGGDWINFSGYPKMFSSFKKKGKVYAKFWSKFINGYVGSNWLKYKFNRPRPYQVADFLGIDLPKNTLESMKTPSYPSGHSIQGIFIAKVLSKMYPKHKKQLMEIGKMISNSRLMARAHYPSDTKLGEKIGELLFLNLK